MCEENVISVSLAKLIAAFAKAKLEMGRLIATETAQVRSEKANYSYTYADLASVLNVIDKPLASNGLVFVQSPVVDYRPPGGATVTIHGTLYHDSGEHLQAAPLVMMSKETDPQKVGSAITYARRYQAVAFFGLAQEDDDGKSAADKSKQQQAQPQRTQAPVPQPAQHRQAQPAQTNGHANGATKPDAQAPVITPTEIAATDAITLDNVPEMSDGHDNPFAPDAAQIHRITEGFNLPKDAWAWAAGNHYTENEYSARTRWATIVKEKFDNAYTPAKLPAIAREYVAYYLAKASAARAA